MRSIPRRLFIHGLDGSSQGVKATYLRQIFDDILTPDFRGSLEERMAQLSTVIGRKHGWRIVGSSFGGLMATYFACWHPRQVDKLILLAPALTWPDFAASLPPPIQIPVIIYHGRKDTLIPLELVKPLAKQVFHNLEFHCVEDDHSLHQTFFKVDWAVLLSD
ncbi:MAG: YqiA/YcfP family alpha/beta fold hydrolase [Chloroflexota bacterium]